MEKFTEQLQDMNKIQNITSLEKFVEVDEPLKRNIKDILDPISDEEITVVIKTLKDVGLESLSDLQFVKEEDLSMVLKPIKRRKLVAAWTLQKSHNHYETPVDSSTESRGIHSRNIWNKKRRVALLQKYAKYKTELYSSNVEVKSVWEKIASEIRKECSIDCTDVQCCYKIQKLEGLYNTLKENGLPSPKLLSLYSEMQKAFETSQNSDSIKSSNNLVSTPKGCENSTTLNQYAKGKSLLSTEMVVNQEKKQAETVHFSQREANDNLKITPTKWHNTARVGLLNVYAKYKAEFHSPGADVKRVWEKIAQEMKIKFLIDCNYQECCLKIHQMEVNYMNMKEAGTFGRKSKHDAFQRAFETEISNNSKTLGKPVELLTSTSSSEISANSVEEKKELTETVASKKRKLTELDGNDEP